jgi:DNA helicase-2/ATP-dependent DNA helicase PcrA
MIDGIGPRTSEKIIDDIVRGSVPSGFWQSYSDYPAGASELFTLLKSLAATGDAPADLTARIRTYYQPILKKKFDDFGKRQKDLEMFEQIAARYRSTEEFLADLALEPPNESVADVASPGEEREFLTLSTIHSAKGLEWAAVFIISALDGRFPSLRSVDDPEELEEERRLMYVACTRAKDHLFITYPANVYDRESGLILTKPSRFLDGLGPQMLEPWVIDEER